MVRSMKSVTFCGHAEVVNSDAVRSWLMATVERLIRQGARTFYLGGSGAFDRMAASVVLELKRPYPQIESVLVLPYLDREMDASGYYATVYPPLETVPRRFAISKRNEWMVDVSDVVVAYVTHDWGGAAKVLEYARRKKKHMINYTEDAMYLDEMLPTEEAVQQKEERLYLLRQLTLLTEKGKMHWHCTKYGPWELIPDGSDQAAQEVLLHSFDATVRYGERTYLASVSEGIGLDDGVSSVIIDVETDGFDCSFFPSDLPLSEALAFSSAVLEQIHGSEVIAAAFREIRHKPICTSNDRYAKHPLVQFGEKLRSAGALMEFHRLVADEKMKRTGA